MNRDSKALAHDRETLRKALIGTVDGVTFRATADFHALDSSVLYASNGSREFVVSVAENVSWGPGLSFYVEKADEFRPVPIMMVDVPNALEGQHEAVHSFFVTWFTA